MSINSEIPRLNPAGQLVLGGVASIFINGVVHPISTMQNCMMANSQLTFSIFIENMRGLDLYRGYRAICLTDAAAFGAAYFINDAFRDRFSPLTASVAAGGLSSPGICIGEGFVRNRQVNGMPYSAIFQRAVRPSGLAATALREIPFTVAVFWLTPILEKQLSSSPSLTAQGVAGSIAGSVAGVITTPFDLIKTRVQTSEQPLTMIAVVRSVYAERGWRGFFRGGGMRSLYIGLAGAGMNVICNTAPRYFGKDLQAKK